MTVRKTAEGRTISGFKMKLYPGFAEEYERRHNELWPEMADMLHEYGGHNYSIFIDEETSTIPSVTRNRPRPRSAGSGGISWPASWRPTPITPR